MPFMSFHFIPSADSAVPDSQSIFYKPFIEGSKSLSFKTSDTERYTKGSGEKEIPKINCRVANPLDLVVMKLKSCSERTTSEKTNNDLMDIIKMLGITGYTVSDAIVRAKEISFDGIRYIDRYGSKIKKSVNLLTNYLRQISSNEVEASRKIDLLVPNSPEEAFE
jgi:hypothetical protein